VSESGFAVESFAALNLAFESRWKDEFQIQELVNWYRAGRQEQVLRIQAVGFWLPIQNDLEPAVVVVSAERQP
jgi:hypothetical protein